LMLWAIVLPRLERLSARGLEFHHAKSADLDPAPMDPGVIESPTGTYRLLDEQFSGDVCDVPLATSNGAMHVLKIPRDPDASDLLAKEREVLHTLHDGDGTTHYCQYLPELVESFSWELRRVNAFAYRDGLYTAEEICLS